MTTPTLHMPHFTAAATGGGLTTPGLRPPLPALRFRAVPVAPTEAAEPPARSSPAAPALTLRFLAGPPGGEGADPRC